ncbi:MAG TPA: hypothetical protein VLJ39_09840 [Tepidisphaeraceae bacterium]|nr:hypothetical protein [Tepidisphaeraceae bacterium]
MKKLSTLAAAAAAAVSVMALSQSARAQTSAALLIKPWEANGAAESTTNGLLLDEGHVKETGNSFQLSELESQGRVRILPGHEASPRFGYDVTLLNIHTSEHGTAFQRGIHSQLLDASLAGGTFLAKENGWVYGVTLGLGYAGNSPFAEGRAWYGRADFVVAKKFSETDAIGIGLDYDGHRSYLPDCPLPGFGYSHTFDPHLEMVIGAPLTSITWKPTDQWRLYLDWLLLSDLDADVSYQFIKHWSVFGAFQTRRDQFYISELHGHTRLMYLQRRLEGGIRFQPNQSLTFKAAIGYAFSNDFRRGYDYRSTSRYIYVTDEPYVSLGLDFAF